MSNEVTPDFMQKLLQKLDNLTAVIAHQANVISEQTATINKLTETLA